MSQCAVIGNPDYTLQNMGTAQSAEFFPLTFLIMPLRRRQNEIDAES